LRSGDTEFPDVSGACGTLLVMTSEPRHAGGQRRLAVLMADRGAVRLALTLALLLAAALMASLIEGAPERFPVALGSDVLLHVERAAALFAIVVAIASVLREAGRGRLPTQLTTAGLAYEADVAAAEAAERLQNQLDEPRGQVETLADLTLGGEEPRR
jgi:hypothetical protein